MADWGLARQNAKLKKLPATIKASINAMRLSPQEHTAINNTLQQADPAAQVYLFGSRANDQQLGGRY